MEAEDPDDDVAFRPPLPPDDRLWRHPSEVRLGAPGPSFVASRDRRRPGGALAVVMATSLVVVLGIAAAGLRDGGPPALVDRQGVVPGAATTLGRPLALTQPPGPGDVPDSGDGPPTALLAKVVPCLALLDDTVPATATAIGEDLLVTALVAIEGRVAALRLADGRRVVAERLGDMPELGLTVLRVASSDAPPAAALGRAIAAVPGSTVAVVGAVGVPGRGPVRIAAVEVGAVTSPMVVGSVEGTGRPLGAPVVGEDGKVIAVVAGSTTGADAEFVAAPVELVVRRAKRIAAGTRSTDGWLGVSLAGRSMVTVADVTGGSPADEAGLRVGDEIVAVDGRPTPSAGHVAIAVRVGEPGSVLRLTIRRDGEARELVVRLGARTAADGRTGSPAAAGGSS